MPAGHALAERSEIHIRDLKNEPLLLLAGDTFMFQLCLSACQKAHFEPRIAFTGHKSENILSMVEKGFGIALLTQSPIQEKLTDSMVMLPIEHKIETAIVLLYGKGRRPTVPEREFISMLQDSGCTA